MDRHLAAAAGTGSLSSVLLHLAARAASNSGVPAPDFCPPCIDLCPDELDWRSLGLGVLLGLAAGPAIDQLYWLRVYWRRTCSRLVALWFRPCIALYKVHEQ